MLFMELLTSMRMGMVQSFLERGMQGLLITVSSFLHQIGSGWTGWMLISSNLWRRKGTRKSNYSSDQRHTGVMGLFYLLVAKPSRQSSSIMHSRDNIGDTVILQNAVWALVGFGIAALVAATVTYQRQSETEEGCESILM